MEKDRLQQQRFELKYIIPEPVALAVRDFVQSYLEVDEFGATLPNLSYPVHSLYLDSDAYTLHHNTINGNKNRFKLRLRFYEDRPGAPVFFEIKNRMDNTISKERGAVKREAVDMILAGHLPSADEMASPDPAQLGAVQNFCAHLNRLQAKPKSHIAYMREAWLPSGGDNSVRVTFDRNVRSCYEPTARLSAQMDNPVVVFGSDVVLELKFTGRYPNWFGDLVRVFGLRQTSAAKYVDGLVLMGELQPEFSALSAAVPQDKSRSRTVRRTRGNFSHFPDKPDA